MVESAGIVIFLGPGAARIGVAADPVILVVRVDQAGRSQWADARGLARGEARCESCNTCANFISVVFQLSINRQFIEFTSFVNPDQELLFHLSIAGSL